MSGCEILSCIKKGIYSCFLTSCYLQSWILKTPVPAYYGSVLCSGQCLHVKWSPKIQKDCASFRYISHSYRTKYSDAMIYKVLDGIRQFFSLALWCKNEDKCCGMKMNMNSMWWAGCNPFSGCLCWCLCPLFKWDKTALCWCCFSYHKNLSSGQTSLTLVRYSLIIMFFVSHLSQET